MMQCAKEVTSQYTRLGCGVQRYRGDDDLIGPTRRVVEYLFSMIDLC